MPESNLAVRTLSIPLPGLPAGLDGLRIAHISDLHFRRWGRIHEELQDSMRSLEPDYLVITGDFCVKPSKWSEPASLTRRLLRPLADRFPCYAVLGNHDLPAFAEKGDVPVAFLRNESATLSHNGVPVELAGLDQSHLRGDNLSEALASPKACELTVLLAHYPSTVFRLPPGRVDLQLSGHTHGGQIRLPFLGCVWPNDRISRHMARGLHAVGGTFVHINPGIGVSQPLPVRFNCPPEATLLTMQSVATPIDAVSEDATSVLAGIRQGPIV